MHGVAVDRLRYYNNGGACVGLPQDGAPAAFGTSWHRDAQQDTAQQDTALVSVAVRVRFIVPCLVLVFLVVCFFRFSESASLPLHLIYHHDATTFESTASRLSGESLLEGLSMTGTASSGGPTTWRTRPPIPSVSDWFARMRTWCLSCTAWEGTAYLAKTRNRNSTIQVDMSVKICPVSMSCSVWSPIKPYPLYLHPLHVPVGFIRCLVSINSRPFYKDEGLLAL